MGDNVRITQSANSTPPDGTIVATDLVGTAHYQRFKLDVGADGVSVPVENTSGAVPVISNGSIVDTGNSSTANLSTGGAFTGAWVDTLPYSAIIVSCTSDVASATDGLSIDWSADGSTKHDEDVFTIGAGASKTFNFQPAWRYFRVVYTNGGTATSSFVLQSQLKKTPVRGSAHRLKDNVSAEDDAELMKTVVTGESDINQIIENVKTYRGALQVDDSLVHKVGIDEHAVRNLDGSTTLDVAASAGDTLINVAATTNFTTGSIIEINGGSTERSHFHIVALVAGVSMTLNRPLDNDHAVGTAVQEVDIGMNVTGTLASPISFKAQPISTERWQITRIMISMLDQTDMDDALFGGLSALTNGVVIRTYNDGVYRTLTHWNSNGDLKDDMYDVEYSTKAPSGFYGLTGRWTFTRSEFVADLDGATGDYIEVLIQDDLSGLDDFEIKCQGRLFGG